MLLPFKKYPFQKRTCFTPTNPVYVINSLILHFVDLLRKMLFGFYKLEKNKVKSIRKMVVATHDVPKQISTANRNRIIGELNKVIY